MTVTDNKGLRHDGGKLKVNLIPPEWTRELARVLTAGAEKYADRNWERGMDWSKVLGPLERHILAWKSGETFDEETGCHHLAMAAWNALALMTYQLRCVGVNDNTFPYGEANDRTHIAQIVCDNHRKVAIKRRQQDQARRQHAEDEEKSGYRPGASSIGSTD